MKAFTTNVVKSIFLPLSVIILVGCGSGTDDPPEDTIVHNGVTYDTVTSPHTGRVWLDRNLGAARVCTSFNDDACYGDYYQWGRNADGHEDMGSPTTKNLASNVNNVGHGKFILTDGGPAVKKSGKKLFKGIPGANHDWASVDNNLITRAQNWSKTDGSSICPKGFRVPTADELFAEFSDGNTTYFKNNIEAFNSFLKLPSSGSRDSGEGKIMEKEHLLVLWTSTVVPIKPGIPTIFVFIFNDTIAAHSYGLPSNGLSVRCIKDN